MKFTPRTALTFAITALLSGSLASAQNTVKVGVIMPFSGVYVALGEEGMRGIQLYFDSIGNKVAGKTIQLIKEDEEADPAVAVRKANKLIASDKVDILAGVVLTPSAYALAPVVEKAQTPLVVFNALGNDLTRSRKNPYVFRASGSGWQFNHPFGKYVAQKVSKNTFLLAADYAFGKDSIRDFKESYTAAGGKVAGEVYTPLGASDFSPYLARIAAAKPDAVYTFLSGSDAILFMKQFVQFGLQKSIKLTVSGDMVDEKFLNSVDKNLVGTISVGPWVQDLPNAQNKLMVDAYRKKYNDVPGLYVVRGWDTARVVAEAIRKVNGNMDNRAALLAAMKTITFPSPHGNFKFDANQNVIHNIYVRQVVDGPNGLVNKTVQSLGSFSNPGK